MRPLSIVRSPGRPGGTGGGVLPPALLTPCLHKAAAVAAAAAGRRRRQTRHAATCVGRHLATRNDVRVSGSRQLGVAVLVCLKRQSTVK